MTYDGGKNATFRHIINQMPPHDIYVELFAGSGAVLRHKRPAKLNVGVEIDRRVYLELSKSYPATVATRRLFYGDALAYLREWEFEARAVTLIYADPPYLMATRSSQRPLYGHEFGDEAQHMELLTLLRGTPALVMLSGYRSELYDRLLSGWRRYEFQAVKRNGQKATECLWMNFPEPMELHDYRWLGTDRIDRQRIKRKTERWRAKFRAMPANERYAILHALKTSGISQLKATAAATADNSDCHRAQMEQTTFA